MIIVKRPKDKRAREIAKKDVEVASKINKIIRERMTEKQTLEIAKEKADVIFLLAPKTNKGALRFFIKRIEKKLELFDYEGKMQFLAELKEGVKDLSKENLTDFLNKISD